MNRLLQNVNLLFLAAIRSRNAYTALRCLEPKLKKYKQKYREVYPRKATIHLVSFDDTPPTMSGLEKKYPGITATVRRGDILENTNSGSYRSSNSWMVDIFCNKPIVVDRGFKCDDYGCPNENFLLVSEFPPGYWDCEYGEFDSGLPVFQWESRTKSQFYWHGETMPCAFDPVELALAKWPVKQVRYASQYKKSEYYVEFKYMGLWYVISDIENIEQFKADVAAGKKMFTNSIECVGCEN